MTYTECDINEKALYTLKIDGRGKFYADYYPIPTDLDLTDSLKNLREMIQEKTQIENIDMEERYLIKKQMVIDYWEKIRKNYPLLLEHRNYCHWLSGAFYESPYVPYNFKMEILPFSQDSDVVEEKIKEIERFLTDQFFQSYFIEQAYEACRNNIKVKAFSHRKGMVQVNRYDLNSLFSIEIRTNFGFGSSSFFWLTMFFKGIKISPYSRLVKYRNISTCDVTKNTWEYSVMDKSWKVVFDKICDVFNNFPLDNHDEFVKKYFIDELEILTNELREYPYKKDFKFYAEYGFGNGADWMQAEKKFKITIDDFPLYIFRCEKIIGAVKFLEIIKQIEEILPTQKYIDIIMDCCKKVLTQLINAIPELMKKVDEFENEYKQNNNSNNKNQRDKHKEYLEKMIKYRDELESIIES